MSLGKTVRFVRGTFVGQFSLSSSLKPQLIWSPDFRSYNLFTMFMQCPTPTVCAPSKKQYHNTLTKALTEFIVNSNHHNNRILHDQKEKDSPLILKSFWFKTVTPIQKVNTATILIICAPLLRCTFQQNFPNNLKRFPYSGPPYLKLVACLNFLLKKKLKKKKEIHAS